jgi:flagellar protein FliS
MSYSNAGGAASHYRQVGTYSGVAGATPHRLIQMLLEGALDKIAVAKGHLDRGDVVQKGNNINWAASIINGLRGSLDMDAGGDIAQNLDDLYEYMVRRLLEAHARNDAEALDEVAKLLRELKSGWDSIPERLRGGVSRDAVRAASGDA